MNLEELLVKYKVIKLGRDNIWRRDTTKAEGVINLSKLFREEFWVQSYPRKVAPVKANLVPYYKDQTTEQIYENLVDRIFDPSVPLRFKLVSVKNKHINPTTWGRVYLNIFETEEDCYSSQTFEICEEIDKLKKQRDELSKTIENLENEILKYALYI